MEHLPNDHKDCPNQHKNNHKLCNETGYSVFNLTESQWTLKAIGKPLESHCRRNTSITRKKEIQKSRTVGVTVRDPIRRKLTIWVRSFEIQKLSQSLPGLPVPPERVSQSLMDVEVSKGKHISRWVDRENLIYVRWSSIKNQMIHRGRRSKTLNEVKPVKHITKNPQFSIDKSHAKGSSCFTSTATLSIQVTEFFQIIGR